MTDEKIRPSQMTSEELHQRFKEKGIYKDKKEKPEPEEDIETVFQNAEKTVPARSSGSGINLSGVGSRLVSVARSLPEPTWIKGSSSGRGRGKGRSQSGGGLPTWFYGGVGNELPSWFYGQQAQTQPAQRKKKHYKQSQPRQARSTRPDWIRW